MRVEEMNTKLTFTQDNFYQRRNNTRSAGVAYFPESLITGAELARGMTYGNSHREYPSQAVYEGIVTGSLEIPIEQIPVIAPRALNADSVVTEFNRADALEDLWKDYQSDDSKATGQPDGFF